MLTKRSLLDLTLIRVRAFMMSSTPLQYEVAIDKPSSSVLIYNNNSKNAKRISRYQYLPVPIQVFAAYKVLFNCFFASGSWWMVPVWGLVWRASYISWDNINSHAEHHVKTMSLLPCGTKLEVKNLKGKSKVYEI